MQRLLIFLGLCCLSLSVFAGTSPIEITPSQPLPKTMAANQTATTVFTLTNNLPLSYPVTVTYKPSAINGVFQHDTTSPDNTCLGTSMPLTYQQSCNWVGTFTAGSKPVATATLQLSYPGNVVKVKQKATVSGVALGRFAFRNENNQVINYLDLAPGHTATLTLHNTGGTSISGFGLVFSDAMVQSYFDGTCINSTTTLAPGASCELSYEIPASPQGGNFTVEATGTNADNAPHVLSGNIASAGHFVFRDNGGSDTTTLDVAPGDDSYLTVHNTGGSPITNFQLVFSDATVQSYFGGNCMTSTSTLAAGAHCTLTYDIPSSPLGVNFTIEARGNNADNTGHILNGDIAVQGHFVFKDDSTGATVSRLDLIPGNSRTLRLENTGGETISRAQPLLDISSPLNTYFSGACLSTTSLAAGASCTFSYTIPDDPTVPLNVGALTLTATGSNADNSPHTLAGSVATIRTYVLNSSTKTVSQCTVDPSTGAISGCADTGVTLTGNPSALVFNAAGTRAFITNYGGNTVFQCTVDPATGAFSNCTNTQADNLSGPRGLVLNAGGTRAFIVNQTSGTVTECTVNLTTGVFSNCNPTGASGLNTPYALVLNAAGTRAYVTNISNTLTQCTVNPSTGAFTGCNPSGATNLADARDVVFNTAGTRLFVVNAGNSSIVQCPVNPVTGAVSPCTSTQADQISAPFSLAFNAAATRAFVMNNGSSSITECTVNPTTGVFSNCNPTGASGFNGPFALAFNPVPRARAFVANANATVMQCTVNTLTGAFSQCSNTGASGYSNVFTLAFNAAGTQAFLGIETNQNNSHVFRCPVNLATGTFSACTNTGAIGLDNLKGLRFDAIGTHAFITNRASASISYCNVDPSSGAFSACANTPTTALDGPRGLTLNAAGTWAFVANGNNNTISRCPVNPLTGGVTSCSNTTATGVLSGPYGLVLNAAGTRAFVTNTGTLESISYCPVDPATGTFSPCHNTTATQLNTPTALVFNATGTRAYVTNGAAVVSGPYIIQCTVDPATGLFSSCADTGASGLFAPLDIVFSPTFSLAWGWGHRA